MNNRAFLVFGKAFDEWACVHDKMVDAFFEENRSGLVKAEYILRKNMEEAWENYLNKDVLDALT